jgi:hypothetical protein
VETSSPDTGLLRVRPCSSNRCGPAPPSHRHHFWWHTYQATFCVDTPQRRLAPTKPRPFRSHAHQIGTVGRCPRSSTRPPQCLPQSRMPCFHPHPHAPDPPSPPLWLQQSLARSAEARQQVGDTEDAAVSSQCTVAEHRTLLLPALIHLCSLPPNCRVLASTAPTTLKASKNKFGVFTGITAKTVQKAETHNVFCPISAKQKNPFLYPTASAGTTPHSFT